MSRTTRGSAPPDPAGAGRRWLELRVGTPAEDARAELVAEALLALGGRAIEERDGWLVTHLEDPGDPDRFLEEARARIQDEALLEEPVVEVSWRPHEEWAETWRRGLGPRRITERIVVRPSWTPLEDPGPGTVVVVLDPGMAFGTAEHGTTRGCLRMLDRAVRPGDRVLDVGAGSAILAIAAALLGAKDVLAIEADPLAWDAMEENVERNGVRDRVRIERAAADAASLARRGPSEGIVANIEAGVLAPLLPGFRGALASGGWLILSGILTEEWPEMREETERHGFHFVEADVDGEWTSGWFRKA